MLAVPYMVSCVNHDSAANTMSCISQQQLSQIMPAGSQQHCSQVSSGFLLLHCTVFFKGLDGCADISVHNTMRLGAHYSELIHALLSA